MDKTQTIALAISAFAIFFTIFFRKEIRSLFPRIQNIGSKGVSLSDTQKKTTNTKVDPFEKQFDEFSRSPYQIQQEELIRQELESKEFNDEKEKTKLLIRALATSVINANCERVSLTIFGSQLEFLVELNASPDGMKIEDIKKWYKDVVIPANPDLSSYSFDQYFGFMKNSSLVDLQGEIVKITLFGNEFMQYLVRTGKTHRRKN